VAGPKNAPLAALPEKLAPWRQRTGAAAGNAFAAMVKEQQVPWQHATSFAALG